MEGVRGSFQGIGNVVRFNWHFYMVALAALVVLAFAAIITSGWLQALSVVAFLGAFLLTTVSLAVTYWVYDLSSLYSMNWLNSINMASGDVLVNINAGFDETSALLCHKYPNAKLKVLDFYDPIKHTEVSIKRARKAYPPYPGTVSVTNTKLPFADASVNCFVATLAAHEIRDNAERIDFLVEVHRILKGDGKVVLTEHLRDTANFMAYNFGAFHFHSRATWLGNFKAAGFTLQQEIKSTPFISTFILCKNGTTS
jgi:ubiquinone/menaquinone biosynthesis C-methylase UbiE